MAAGNDWLPRWRTLHASARRHPATRASVSTGRGDGGDLDHLAAERAPRLGDHAAQLPGGLAIGVAFGSAAAGYPEATVGAAVALAIGIGLQNFPEGAAVSFPLRREGYPRPCLLLGSALGRGRTAGRPARGGGGHHRGAGATLRLAFAAGAMIFVVVEELIPESQQGGHADLATLALLGGFAIMMTLDVALG